MEQLLFMYAIFLIPLSFFGGLRGNNSSLVYKAGLGQTQARAGAFHSISAAFENDPFPPHWVPNLDRQR